VEELGLMIEIDMGLQHHLKLASSWLMGNYLIAIVGPTLILAIQRFGCDDITAATLVMLIDRHMGPERYLMFGDVGIKPGKFKGDVRGDPRDGICGGG
jgi:hypothetical protein